jgi:hypothetical protein
MKKIIATLIIISLLGVPSFVYAEGGKEMANYGSGWTEMKTTSQKATSPNVIKNSIFMYDDKGRPATVSPDVVDKYKAMGWTMNSDIFYDSDGIPRSNSGGGSSIDYEAQLKALRDAQYQARAEALDKQRNSSLSDLDSEKSKIAPRYYDKRNQAGAQSDVGALNFAQFMASRSIQGNAGAMPEIYRNNALQSNIGALNQQEATENANIESRRSDINRAYESDLAAAKADIDAQTMAAQIEQQRIDATNALEQQKYNTQLKTAADVTAYNRLQDAKGEYANTVGQFSNDYQAEIEKVANDGDPTNDWQLQYLSAARAQKMKDQKEQEAAAAAAQATAEAEAEQQQFENDLKTKQYDLDVKKTNYDINRPYSSGGSKTLTPLQQQNNTNNSKISQMTNWIYNVTTNAEALNRLTQNKSMILQQLMEAGYDGSAALKYYNDMYTDLAGN